MHGVSRLIASCLLAGLLFHSFPALAASRADFPDGLVWFNAAEPVKLLKISGHFVLVHFGIYSAPNADATVNDLKALASKYPDELDIIGVHAAKFFDQNTFDDIRKAVQLQNIHYPVAVDEHLAAWKLFHVSALPTVILFAPDGEVLFRKPGADVFYYVDRVLTQHAAHYASSLSHQPVFHLTTMPGAVQNSGGSAPSNPPQTTQLPSGKFDFTDFVGEPVRINREYSRSVGKIKVSLVLPPKTHLLATVKSYVRIFTSEGAPLGGLETLDPVVEIPIDRVIGGDRLYIEASFYYTNEGGLDLFKGFLFEVPLADYSKSENIEINYTVSNP